MLFCRAHRTQLADIEKLQCPRGCGQLHLRLSNKSMYFHCRKCKGALLDAKMLETKLSERADMLNELLENGEECSLRCPRCEGLMLEIRVVYEMPKGGGAGNLGSVGDIGHPGALIGILLIVVVVAAISAAAQSKKSLSIKGTTKEELSTLETDKADMEELHLAAKREAAMLGASCMHFEERGMPPALEQCKRPKHRGTEYCYMHQPK